jgi:predicted nucleotidyltransferase component of viral defense system
LPQLRFSQDLDFTALKEVTINDLRSIYEQYEFLEIRKHHTSSATVKIERLLYQGVLDMPASLRMEIDFTQNVVLPAKIVSYKNVYGVDVKVNVMDIKEICAEKIRAMNERYRYRDFYDFGMMMREFKFDLDEIVELLYRKELRQPLLASNIVEHWQLARKAKQKDTAQIFVAEEIEDQKIEEYVKRVPLK